MRVNCNNLAKNRWAEKEKFVELENNEELLINFIRENTNV